MAYLLIGLVLMGAAVLSAAPDQDSYKKEIRAWQKHREAGLRAPDSWLTLAGLFWLPAEGKSTIGSGETSDFMLPRNAPSQVGQFKVEHGEVTFTSLMGDQVSVNGKPFRGTIAVKHDKDEDKSDKLAVGAVQFYVIDRDSRLAVRVKNAASEVLKNFKGTEFFPVNPALRFEAKFIEKPAKIPVPNVLNKTDLEDSPGLVEFEYEGKTYQLRPIFEDQTLFFIFKDPTSKTQTYPAGRMVNTPLPKDGRVTLDFNRAYNPPCAFTPYATCPLPPKENILPFPVTAGELRYGDEH